MDLKSLYFSIIVILLVACSQEEAYITFETVTVDKTVALSNDDVPPTCSVNLNLQEATPQSGRPGQLINATVTERLFGRKDEQMKTAAEAFAKEYTSNYSKSLLPLYNQDRADTTKWSWYHYHYIVNSSTQKGSKGVIVYLANLNFQEGGAHANNQLMAMNFETKTGRLLTLDDVFVTGYASQLNAILLKALQSKVGVSSLKDLHSKGYLRGVDIYPPDNFILGSEAVTFIYNPDEIAAYSFGQIDLTIAYTAMANILRTTFEY